MNLKIYIGADHRGFNFKKEIIGLLHDLGYEAQDLGTYDTENCDYPRIGFEVAQKVSQSKDARGILVCMSGIGQTIVANKVRGAYAALCYNAEAAKLSRAHNNANILVLGSKFVDHKELKDIIKVWLTTEFEGGRHQRRLDLIKEIEKGKGI